MGCCNTEQKPEGAVGGCCGGSKMEEKAADACCSGVKMDEKSMGGCCGGSGKKENSSCCPGGKMAGFFKRLFGAKNKGSCH